MNKKLKELIKKHVNIIKNMYPGLYIAVEMDGDEIFICIDSLDISNEEKYEDLLHDFRKEYHRKGYGNIFWGVNATLICDNLEILEDFVEVSRNELSQKEILQRKIANF